MRCVDTEPIGARGPRRFRNGPGVLPGGLGVVVLGLVLLLAGCGTRGAADLEEVDASAMESHGCGFGFWLGTPGQDVAIHLRVADPEAAARGDVPEQATLPHDAWDGTVLVGRDLFANWCDDVLEPGEPEPVVDEEWPITAGAVTLHAPAPEISCPGELTADLEGLEATRPDGTSVELGDREVTNATWGCVAG